VVALQIHGVSEPTRRALSAEAKARGDSLQEYLLDILDREARDLGDRQILVEWHADTQMVGTQSIDFVHLISSEGDRQEPQFARGG
jgi:antitoxin FitA